ncbi:MAG: hypothetical protein JO187_02290 [Acidobacteria bacterium]|nr:hypothetical protein [Acidobacteriota bacterium]
MSQDKKPITGNVAHGHVPAKKPSLDVHVQKMRGPGQTRMDLTQDAVQEYKKAHKAPAAASGKERPSLLTRLVGMFKKTGAGAS